MIFVPLGAAWCADDAAVDASAGVAVSARAAAGTASNASDLRMDMGILLFPPSRVPCMAEWPPKQDRVRR
jgi:hypothetical protein